MKYYPYGDRLESEANLPTDRLFTGQRYDDTGLYYYGARYYDPEIGRFISPDTIIPNPSNPQSLNRYSYCLNNPLKYVDPSGHEYSVVFTGDPNSMEDILAYVYYCKQVEDAYQQIMNDSDIPAWVQSYMQEIHDSERIVNIDFGNYGGEGAAINAVEIYASGHLVATTQDRILISTSRINNLAPILAHETYHIYEGNPGATIEEELWAYSAKYIVNKQDNPWFKKDAVEPIGDNLLAKVKNDLTQGTGNAANVYAEMPYYQQQMTNTIVLKQALVASKATGVDFLAFYLNGTFQFRSIPWH